MATFRDIHGKTLFFAFILTLLILMCFGSSSVEAQGGQLPRDEEEALEEIAEQVGGKRIGTSA